MLEQTYQQYQNIEKQFKNKSILFVGNESYDAVTISIIQGLQELGFTIYVIGKHNINSWFVDTIINNPRNYDFDFVLSNLHWGTRWSYYDKFYLHNRIKVLIDSDDNPIDNEIWKDKYTRYQQKYRPFPSEGIAENQKQIFRWIEPLGNYQPDIVFSSQMNPGDKFVYLPFGIQRDYIEQKKNLDRIYDFTHISGPGPKRKRLTNYLRKNSLIGNVFNNHVYGEAICPCTPEWLIEWFVKDKNIHSASRWFIYDEYYRTLNKTKVLIYPGVYDTPQWDSKRPWEALASGCLLMLEKPTIDMSQYPITELCEFTVYNSYDELRDKSFWLNRNQDKMENMRIESYNKAMRYFTPGNLARYFLFNIKRKTK